MKISRPIAFIAALSGVCILAGCSDNDNDRKPPAASSSSSSMTSSVSSMSSSSSSLSPVEVGKNVFRFETFGNEGFWTDAMQLPQGIIAAELTPLQALSLGLSVNAESLEPTFAGVVVAQINAALAGQDAPALSDPAITLELIRQGAVIGVVPFGADGKRLPLGSDPTFSDSAQIAKVGVSCALCHSVTDGSVLAANTVGPGSVGVQIDGRAAEKLDVGAIFAASGNPLAYLPFLQLKFDALDGATLGRGDFAGIDSSLTIEQQTAQAREYLTSNNAKGMRHYPVTSFDATPDGIGNATYIAPFFRTDLAAPWGSSGSFEKLEDFNNLVYTVALDPTSLLTPKGRTLLNVLAGPVGDEIATRYEATLKATGVIPMGVATEDAIPFVKATRTDIDAGASAGPTGRRVDNDLLSALNAYTDQLPAPPVKDGLDAAKVAFGKSIFMNARADGGANCAACHTSDPSMPVENDRIRPINELYRAYDDDVLVLLDRSNVGLSPVQTTLAGPNPEYTLTLTVLDATRRLAENANAGLVNGRTPAERFVRGYAKPLLIGLGDKDEFLHNGSVSAPEGYLPASANASLDFLLNPAREAPTVLTNDDRVAPHAFYFPQVGEVDDPDGRDALVQYLLSRTPL